MSTALPLTKLTLDEALRSARETRALVVGRQVLAEVPRVFQENFPHATAVIVADETTVRVAGRAVNEARARRHPAP